MGRKWRQQPIACQSCRRRKIRCSREFPCSNCTSRGIECVQFHGVQEPNLAATAENRPDPASQMPLQRLLPEPPLWRDSCEPVSVLFPNADIEARLDRLENYITGLYVSRAAAQSTPGDKTDDARRDQRQRQKQLQFAPDTATTDTTTDTTPRQVPPLQMSTTLEQIAADAVWFGGNLMLNKPRLMLTCTSPAESYFDASISFHLSPIRLIKKPCCVLQDVSAGQVGSGARQMCIFLPLYHEACTIANTFTSDWTVLSPTIHVPTLLVCVQTIYTSIQEQKPVSLDELLLFLCMIASVMHASCFGDDVSRLFDSHPEACSQCATWIDAAFSMSDEVKRRGLTGIVCLQALTILTKVSCYMEGSSVRNRSLVSTSIAMARELGIHRVDLPGEKPGLNSPMEIEIARRLWWDNTTLDWFLALFPGPHEGVYTIHPQHMAVNKPSSVLGCATNGNEQPPPNVQAQQTDLSYFLSRIRLAEIGRELVDSCPLSRLSTHEHKQEKLHEYNAKLEELQRNLPCHLALRKPGEMPELRGEEQPSFVFQSIHINCLIYIQRCIVHLRFPSFASAGQRFSFSYDVCLGCARDIVSMHKVIKSDHPWIIPRLRTNSYLRALLLASAIFLLDVCSGTEIRDLESQRPDMLEAWRLLGEMREDSNLIDQFLDFSSQMLKKYSVADLIVSALADAVSSGSVETPPHPPYHPMPDQADMSQMDGSTTSQDMPMDGPSTSQDMPMDATQRWQTLDADFDIKTMSWDNVLWGFDTILM